jgi:uncharacterized iron-regulated membrane protein
MTHVITVKNVTRRRTKMKRDWNKINFWMILFILFLVVAVILTGQAYKLQKQSNSRLDYQCSIRGLNVYNKNGLECIGNDGAVYDIPVHPISGLIIMVIVTAASIMGSIYALHTIYSEYQRGE